MLSNISAAKNALIDHETFARTAESFTDKTTARVYTAYQKALRTANWRTSTTCSCSPRGCSRAARISGRSARTGGSTC